MTAAQPPVPPPPHPLPGASGPATTSGTIIAAQGAVTLPTGDQGTVACQVTGTWSATLTFEGTVDNTTWVTIKANALASDTLVTTTTGNGVFVMGAGLTAVRVRCSAYTSGTATVTLRATPNTSAVLPVSMAAGGGVGGGAVVIADGADTALGTTTDAGIITDIAGTVIGFLRGSIKMWLNYLARFPAALTGSGNLKVGVVESTATVTIAGSVGGFSADPLVTLTRPANTTAYTAQDEVATTGTAPVSFSVARVTGQTGIITGADLIYSNNPAVTPAFRLLLFSAPVTAAGDNVALALSDADAALFIGMIDFTQTQAGGAATSANLMMSGAAVNAKPFTTDTIFGLLITTNAFTPIANSETIKIRLNNEQN